MVETSYQEVSQKLDAEQKSTQQLTKTLGESQERVTQLEAQLRDQIAAKKTAVKDLEQAH